MGEVKKAVGRPAKYEQAMTPAMRMKEYRRRHLAKLEQAGDNPGLASDRFLAESLAMVFKSPHHDSGVQDFLIEKYLQELCNHYKIRIPQ